MVSISHDTSIADFKSLSLIQSSWEALEAGTNFICAWVKTVIILTLINRGAKNLEDFFKNWLSHVRLVINLVEDNLSYIWELNERNEAGGFGYSTNCSILINDIVNIIPDATSNSFEILDLFVKIYNRAYLLKGTSSLFLMLFWSRITLGYLADLLDCVGNFVNLLLSWLSTTRNDGWVHKNWLWSITFSNTWYIDNRVYPSSIWFCYIF